MIYEEAKQVLVRHEGSYVESERDTSIRIHSGKDKTREKNEVQRFADESESISPYPCPVLIE